MLSDKQSKLTQDLLKSVLHYDPETGQFLWLVRRGRIMAGSIAGAPHNHGYRQISVYGENYLAHRLAFLWMFGRFPVADVDHVNGTRNDNRWSNLREASRKENMWNMGKPQGVVVSSYKGVHLSTNGDKWVARLQIEGVNTHLGTFDDEESAARAYDLNAVKYYGAFARLNFNT